ncbi:MAG: PQQ-binding-like beta-propeller repeat protein [Verrucomicrobia bacterium]|nr:PQQ-binding-like beta-propeller repeat protein [Verrucomicrobiota bacterium]
MRAVYPTLLLCILTLKLLGQDPGTLKWSYPTTGEIYSSPAIDIDGVLYIGVNDDSDNGINDSAVIALNPDGSLKWKTEISDWVDATPALGPDGVLYVGSWDGYIYALDMETGSEIWKFETFGVIVSSAAIGEDGVIYFGNGESALYAVNPDGTPTWTARFNTDDPSPFLFDDWVDCSPTLDTAGNIWAADLFGNLTQIAPDKTELWTIDLGFGIPTSPAIGKDGTVYYGDDDGFVIAITPGVEDPKWAFNTGFEGIESSPVIGPDGTVYIGTGDDRLFAFDGQTGAVKSGWPFTGPGDVVYSTPAIAENGTIYFGSGDKKLYAVDSSGNKLWEFATGGFVDSSPAIGTDGTVYFGSTDGIVYAVYGDSPLGFSRWPKFRGSLAAHGKVDPYRGWVESQNLAEPNPFSDPDEDGLENVLEWAFCTDPQDAGLNDVKFPYTAFTEQGLILQAEWIVEALGIGFEYSDTLEDWENMDLDSPENYPWLVNVSSEEMDEKLQVELSLDPDGLPRFFRLTGIQD